MASASSAAGAGADDAIADAILTELAASSTIPSSRDFAASISTPYPLVESVLKSLIGFELVAFKEIKNQRWALTDEGLEYAENGSPEVHLFNAVEVGGSTKAELEEKVGATVVKIGWGQAMKNKWLQKSETGVIRKVEHVGDKLQLLLKRIKNGEVPVVYKDEKVVVDPEIEALKKRKLVILETCKSYSLSKGPKYAPKRKKEVSVLTREHIQSGEWKDLEFKEYNFNAQPPIQTGYLHPLLEVREAIQNIFLQMGFEEMPTNNYVESSFWNFDALFQPQQHPARDSHDTFFLQAPSSTSQMPEDYLERVKRVHESGYGCGSKGYGYDWKRDESEKNLLRTHTTAVSARMLYKLAQQKPFSPKRYYSIDRVFRNEAVDRTHLAEFHQIEGLICDRGLTLADLFGVLRDFFARLGMTKLKFKPAYNPYTEPSMEIFCYHEGLKKSVEIGNSGMFRAEMLLPMGFPEDVNVIAWGLSLERPTMILYGYDNIRDLFGPKVNFQRIKDNPLCRLGLQSISEGTSSLSL